MGMKATENNCKAAVEIMKVLADNKCTVADVWGILDYVEKKIRNVTTVPKQDYDSLLNQLLTPDEE